MNNASTCCHVSRDDAPRRAAPRRSRQTWASSSRAGVTRASWVHLRSVRLKLNSTDSNGNKIKLKFLFSTVYRNTTTDEKNLIYYYKTTESYKCIINILINYKMNWQNELTLKNLISVFIWIRLINIYKVWKRKPKKGMIFAN